MSEINCNVITDLLELYADGIVSDDTRRIVDKHLSECPQCNDRLAQIRMSVTIPAQTEIVPFKRIHKGMKRYRKSVVIAAVVVFAIVVGLFAAWHLPYYTGSSIVPISFEEIEMRVTIADEQVNIVFSSDDFASFATHVIYDGRNQTAALHFVVNSQIRRNPTPAAEELITFDVSDLTEGYTLAQVYYCTRYFRHLDCRGAVLVWERE